MHGFLVLIITINLGAFNYDNNNYDDEVRKGYFLLKKMSTWRNIVRNLLDRHYSFFAINSLISYEKVPKGIEPIFNVQIPLLNEILVGNIFQLGLCVVL